MVVRVVAERVAVAHVAAEHAVVVLVAVARVVVEAHVVVVLAAVGHVVVARAVVEQYVVVCVKAALRLLFCALPQGYLHARWHGFPQQQHDSHLPWPLQV